MDRKTIKLPITLCLVSMVMAFLICGVYMLTKDRIAERAAEAQESARRAVLSAAVSLSELTIGENDPVDNAFAGYDAMGGLVGYVSQITVNGFGGEIEITVGMDMTGTITAISVGGANFSETSGLGAKTRDAAFTDQFAGKSGLLVLKENIDSVTGASVSSGAVVGGVNAALNYMTALLPIDESAPVEELPLSAEELAALLPGDTVRFMGKTSGIDGWWQGETGYIVQATGYGRGPISVKMGFTAGGVCCGIVIGDEYFTESEGYGAKLLEPGYGQQFIGKTGAQSYGNGIDAISGATTSSNGALTAINACMTFDPNSFDPNAAATPASGEASAETAATASTEAASTAMAADAVTEASIVEETAPTPAPTAVPVIDAVTEASVVEEVTPAPAPTPTPDAVSEASVVEPVVVITPSPAPTATPAPTPAPVIDAVTEASVVEEVTPVPTPTPDAVTEASITED